MRSASLATRTSTSCAIRRSARHRTSVARSSIRSSRSATRPMPIAIRFTRSRGCRRAGSRSAPASGPPDVTRSRAYRAKYGTGASLEQQLPYDARAFVRLGWTDGGIESFAYTEVDNTVAIGGDIRGTAWHRPLDRAGLALVTNGL